MRASMTYAFGRILRRGSMNWQWSESKNKMIGNPSISETVSTYMLSLRRRKAGLLLPTYLPMLTPISLPGPGW